MAVNPELERFLYGYTDDDGNPWGLLLTAGHAAAGFFSAASPSAPVWPRQNRRHRTRQIYGVTTDGLQRAHISAPTLDVYNGTYLAGTFELNGTNYNVTGKSGERVSKNKLPA